MSSCPVCASESRFEAGFDDVRLFRCGKCGHCFSDWSSFEKAENYGAEYYAETHRNWFEHPNLALFDALLKRIVALNPNASVLDVGCGDGGFLRFLRDHAPGLSLCGIDVSANAADSRIDYHQGDFSTWNPGKNFDAVISLAVIEHVPDPRAFARRIHDLTRPGGFSAILTVNESGVVYRTARLLRRAGIDLPFKRLYDRHHLNHFNLLSLRNLMSAAGFTVVDLMLLDSPLAAIDIPPASAPLRLVMTLGIAGLALAGKLTGMTTLQAVLLTRN